MNEYMREILNRIRILVDIILKNEVLDDDALHELKELVDALSRAKENETIEIPRFWRV